MDKEFIAQAKERIDALISRLGDPDLFPDEKAELLAELRREVDGLKFAEDAERARAQKEKEERERLEREREEQEERERREAHAKEVTCTDLPVDWVNVFDTDDRAFGVHFDSCADGLIASLSNLGRVDIEYIASVTGRDYKAVIGELKGAILQNPETWQETFYKGWETTEEYLSGNLMRKLRIAREANEQYCGYFADNVAAIEEVLPAAATAKDIHAALGSPWLPTDIVDDFIFFLFGEPSGYKEADEAEKEQMRRMWQTKHDEMIGTWEIPQKSRYHGSVAVTHTYGTARMEGMYILEKTLNMKNIVVTDEISCPTSPTGTKRILNKKETIAALEKQGEIAQAFEKWIWAEPGRRERLVEIFENKYGCVRRRKFDGAFLNFPGMDPSIRLYPYQKDAVARIIFTPNVLLAHDVGAGKTFVMIAAGQELRRMGLSKKNLYVVPNNIVGQWQEIFRQMYPSAKILCVEPKTFTPQKREQVLQNIRDNDYDGIVMAYSCFEQIPVSKDFRLDELRAQRDEIQEEIDQGEATSALRRKLETVKKKLSEEAAKVEEDKSICFDDLGIDRLFVDEAHNFKNVPIETKIESVLGISSAGSKRCADMLDKVRAVQRRHDGKGVVMATGTPITNSVTDVYVMQNYLQSGELAMLDLQNFDSWVGMFAEKTTEFEIDVDTSSYRLATRFAKFHNLPELTTLLSSIADFHAVDSSAHIPSFDGYTDANVARTDEFKAYLEELSERADAVRSRNVERTEDNMLKITTDGRKAALDIRLVNPKASFSYQSKVARCAENVAVIYRRTAAAKSTQLVFCDISTPKDEFNIYDELARLLVDYGVDRRDIAYIHTANTEKKREELFERVRSGDIRILIGSTFKLGLGVNIQDKLIALHHLDVPWRPADMTQREGRILRQGNTNAKVFIHRYITEGSFDAYSWQLLETKQRFIAALLSGSLDARSSSDIDSIVLNYAEVKAIAVGNPLVKKRVETANELSRCLMLRRNSVEARLNMEQELADLPEKIGAQRIKTEACAQDLEYVRDMRLRESVFAAGADKKEETEKRRALRESIGNAVRAYAWATEETTLCDYCGFELILPANMIPEKPYVWLKRMDRHYVELGDADIGILKRLDNALDGIGDELKRHQKVLRELEERERDIRYELAKFDSYAEQIEELKKQLAKIDEKLGVNQDE